MINRLTDEMINKECEGISNDMSKDYPYECGFTDGANYAREYYETIIKDLFYIQPIDWKLEKINFSYEYFYNHNYCIRHKTTNNNCVIFYKNYHIGLALSLNEAKKVVEEHRIEQIIANGLKRVEI